MNILNGFIQEFLEERRESDSGWAEVKPEDIQLLSSIIYELINLKFEKDCDGDLPINFELANRHKERFIAITKVSYESDEDVFDYHGKIRSLTSAIKILSHELDHELHRLWNFGNNKVDVTIVEDK